MTLDAARALVRSLQSAIQKAEDEGRDHLLESDLAAFIDADDAARIALAAAISKADV